MGTGLTGTQEQDAPITTSKDSDRSDIAAAQLDAAKGDTLVGKTAKRLGFASRWLPGKLRKQTRASARTLG